MKPNCRGLPCSAAFNTPSRFSLICCSNLDHSNDRIGKAALLLLKALFCKRRDKINWPIRIKQYLRKTRLLFGAACWHSSEGFRNFFLGVLSGLILQEEEFHRFISSSDKQLPRQSCAGQSAPRMHSASSQTQAPHSPDGLTSPSTRCAPHLHCSSSLFADTGWISVR